MTIRGPIRSAPLWVCLVAAGGVAAQTDAPGATFRGRVVDRADGAPVAGVLVRLASGEEALSDVNGRFVLEGLSAGSHMYALLTQGCRITWGEVELSPGDGPERALELPPDLQAARARERRDVERRRSEGRLVTAEEIALMPARTVTDVVRRLAPSMVGGPISRAGAVSSIRSRSRNSMVAGQEPIVVVDGARQAHGSRVLDELRATDVESVELLPSVTAGWEYGSSGNSGVIKVTTRKGASTLAPSTPRACVVPGFPGGG